MAVVAPPHFIVLDTSIRGPVTIQPGMSETFVVNYRIASDAPDGEFQVKLDIEEATREVDWTPVDPDATVSYKIDNSPATIGIIAFHRTREYPALQGAHNTPETAIWVHNQLKQPEGLRGIKFQANDLIPGTELPGSGVARLFVGSADFNPNTAYLDQSFPLQTDPRGGVSADFIVLPEGTGYAVAANDHMGLGTTVYFHVDSKEPEVTYKLTVAPDLSVRAAGTARDETAGIWDVFLNPFSTAAVLSFAPETGPPREHVVDFDLPVPRISGPAASLHYLSAADVGDLIAGANPVVLEYDPNVPHSPSDLLSLAEKGNAGWFKIPDAGDLANILKGLDPFLFCPGTVGPANCGTVFVSIRSRTDPVPLSTGTAMVEREIESTPQQLVASFPVTNPPTAGSVNVSLPLGPIVEMNIDVSGTPAGHLGYRMETLKGFGSIDVPMFHMPEGTNVTLDVGPFRMTLAHIMPGFDNRIGFFARVPLTPPDPSLRTLPNQPADEGFNIFTTARFVPPVKLAFKYSPPSTGLTEEQERHIRLFHLKGETWTDITTGVDTALKTVTGETDGFSIFALFIATSIAPLPDRVPPQTSAGFTGPVFVGDAGRRFMSTASSVTLTSVDEGSAVADVYFVVDPSPSLLAEGLRAATTPQFQVFQIPFGLPPGEHVVAFGAGDAAGNFESLRTLVALVDDGPPLTTLTVDGRFIIDPSSRIVMGTEAAILLSATDPPAFGVSAGASTTFFLVDRAPLDCPGGGPLDPPDFSAPAGTCANAAYSGPFSLGPGSRTVAFWSIDNVGNREAANLQAFLVQEDRLPPRPSLAVGIPQSGVDPVIVSSLTPLSINAPDDRDVVGDGLGTGARGVFLAFGDASFQLFSGSFTLVPPDGLKTVRFFAIDAASNTSAVHVSTIGLDSTAPETALEVFGSSRTRDGRLEVDFDSQIGFNVRDPPSGGVAAGPGQTSYLVDAAPETCPGGSPQEPPDTASPPGTCANPRFTGPFTLGIGIYTLYYASTDRVLNREAWKSQAVEVTTFDTLPPRTSLVIGGPRTGFSPIIVSSLTRMGFTAIDDLEFFNDVAGEGVRETSFSVGDALFQVFVSSFTLAPPDGFRTIRFFSVDFSSNTEQVKTSTVALDATPPTARLAFQGNVFLNDQNQLHIRAGNTFVSFLSSDPVVGGVSAGSTRTFFLVGDFVDPVSTPFREFAQPFTLSEGTYAVRTFAIDRVGNRGPVSFRTILANGTPPTTELVVLGSSSVANGEILIQQGTQLTLMAKDPVSGGVASGVGGVFFLIDISPDQCPDQDPDPTKPPGTCDNPIFSGPFSLGIGTHTVFWASVDNVQNEEDVKSARISVLPPVEVSLKIKPHRINLKSQGRKITAIFKIPGPRTAREIDPDSVRIVAINDQRLADPLEPLGHQKAGKDKEKRGDDGEEDETDWDEDEKKDDREHGNGTDRLKLKFDRQELIAILPLGEQVKVTAEGKLFDGTPFTASDLVKTINPGKIKAFESGAAFHPATGAKVQVPQGALPSDTDITVLALGAEPEEDRAKQEEKAEYRRLKLVGKPYEFEPEGTRFTVPVTLTLPYDPKALNGSDPKTLKIAYWNPKTNDWEPLASTVDLAQRTVSAQTDHFSHYQVAGGGGGGGSPGPGVQGVQDAFGLIEAYAFPSPAYPGQRPTIRAQVGLADSVSVNIYDISGQLVHSAGFGAPQLLDDGNGKGQQWTCDYSWDVSGVGSGVYIFAVTAKKSGQADIKVIKKLGVIK